MKTSSSIAILLAVSFCVLLTGCQQTTSGEYKISGEISKVEFEDLKILDSTPGLEIVTDKNKIYPWSDGKGILLSAPKEYEYVMYQVAVDDDTPRNVKIYGFKNPEYGRYRMAINDHATGKLIDFYGRRGERIEGFDLGTFRVIDGKIKVTFALVGTSAKSIGKRYGAAIDYMVITKDTDSKAY
jgi:hypothetical protein